MYARARRDVPNVTEPTAERDKSRVSDRPNIVGAPVDIQAFRRVLPSGTASNGYPHRAGPVRVTLSGRRDGLSGEDASPPFRHIDKFV